MWPQNAVLRSFSRRLQDALDDKHYVRTAGVVLVEDQGDGRQRPGQDTVAELSDLFAVFKTMASLPIRSIRLMWLSRLIRMQASWAATCSTWVDLPVPW